MKKEKYALLVIDMQLVAFDGKITPPVTNGFTLLNAISELIDTCRAATIPIVFLQACGASGRPYAKDAHGWEIHPSLDPRATDKVVYKVQSSGFEDTKLQDLLLDIGATTLITCGIWSEFCVTATSKDAQAFGYDVWVVADGHSTVAASDEEAADKIDAQNQALCALGMQVLDVDSIRMRLLDTA